MPQTINDRIHMQPLALQQVETVARNLFQPFAGSRAGLILPAGGILYNMPYSSALKKSAIRTGVIDNSRIGSSFSIAAKSVSLLSQ